MAIKRDFRDTQFIGFAEALWSEIGELTDTFCQESGTGVHSLVRDMNRSETFEQTVQTLIAQRAYDLVKHTIEHMKPYIYDEKLAGQESPADVPDMTEWLEREVGKDSKRSIGEIRKLLEPYKQIEVDNEQ